MRSPFIIYSLSIHTAVKYTQTHLLIHPQLLPNPVLQATSTEESRREWHTYIQVRRADTWRAHIMAKLIADMLQQDCQKKQQMDEKKSRTMALGSTD